MKPVELTPTLKLLSFFALCWVAGWGTANVILDDLAYWWVTIPAVPLLGFAAYHAMQVTPTREQFFLAMLIAMTTNLLLRDLVFWGSLTTGIALLLFAAYRAMNGKRDPFFSPVVQQNGSGCSTGKKCLEIGNINLRGVVKSDTGFIAVVTNSLNKAYFLRENDPVFNGYVVKITGDSVTFQETVQDKLGKTFTREVVKRIFTPAV